MFLLSVYVTSSYFIIYSCIKDPDWSAQGSDQGCLSDGNQPAYMNADPGSYMHSTLDKCCSTHFAWNYDGCMGLLDDTCVRALWYPDWEGTDNGCVRDGAEPLYMTENSVVYLFSTKRDCCEEHYSFSLEKCLGTSAGTSGRKYYPDWLGDNTCKNNGAAPTYMVQNPAMWLSDTLEACCNTHYSWKKAECMGTTFSAASGLYFPDWEGVDDRCINDTVAPAYMLQNPALWLSDTLEACCNTHYSWKKAECMINGGNAPAASGLYYPDWEGADNSCIKDTASSRAPLYMQEAKTWFYDTLEKCCSAHYQYNISGCTGQPSSVTSGAPVSSTGKYYVDWKNYKCSKDCDSGTAGCGGLAQSWDVLYDSKDQCCRESLGWNYKDCIA